MTTSQTSEMYSVRKMRGTASCSRKPKSRRVGERQVNIRVVPTCKAIEESVDLAHEIIIQSGFP